MTKVAKSARSLVIASRAACLSIFHNAYAERVALTRELIDAGAPAMVEASFLADNTFVAVDVLTPLDSGAHLTEVKSSSSQKEEHLLDAAC